MSQARRRHFILAAGALLAAPFASLAQQPGKVWRIVFLTTSRPDSKSVEGDVYSSAFLREMQNAGHTFGVDYVVELRSFDDYERLPAKAGEGLLVNADIIIPISPTAVDVAYKGTKTVPIVCIGVHDPVGMRLVTSLAHPGGNLTGLATFYADLVPKQLEVLKSIVPKVSRVAVLVNAKVVTDAAAEKRAFDAAQMLGIRLQVVPIDSTDQLPKAFATIARERAGAVMILADAMFVRERSQIADLSLKHRLPSIFANRENVQAGGLVSYGEDFIDMFGQAAKFVSKIMKGAKPGDLPIEQPTKFQLTINRKTAKALKLKIPQELLVRADMVIE